MRGLNPDATYFSKYPDLLPSPPRFLSLQSVILAATDRIFPFITPQTRHEELEILRSRDRRQAFEAKVSGIGLPPTSLRLECFRSL